MYLLIPDLGQEAAVFLHAEDPLYYSTFEITPMVHGVRFIAVIDFQQPHGIFILHLTTTATSKLLLQQARQFTHTPQ